MNQISTKEPSISVNKLSEYMVSPAGRRKTIIKDQKKPSVIKVQYYQEARSIIVDYLTQPCKDSQWLPQKIQSITRELSSLSSQSTKIRKRSSINALEKFQELIPELDFGKLNFIRGNSKAPKIVIGELPISIKPEIYLLNDEKIVGCIKLAFRKEPVIDKKEAEYTGVCLQRWIEEYHDFSKGKWCFTYDVLRKNIYQAPKAYKKRMKDIQAACEEISRAWPSA